MSQPLPRYQSHKIIEALQIAEIQPVLHPTFEGVVCRGSIAFGTACNNCARCEWEKTNPPQPGSAMIVPVENGYEPFNVSADYIAKHGPRVGGFWVRYPDGYESWSPHDVFTEGYSRVDEVLPVPSSNEINSPDLRVIKSYPCGCSAGPGPADMPDYCPDHGSADKPEGCRTITLSGFFTSTPEPVPTSAPADVPTSESSAAD